MNLYGKSSKEVGILGERVAGEYLRRHGFTLVGRNIKSNFGEIDIVARSHECLYIIEVKARLCDEFPNEQSENAFNPSDNLHRRKISKVARLGSWYVGVTEWEGEWQVDGVVVWLRKRDGMARVRYYPQLV